MVNAKSGSILVTFGLLDFSPLELFLCFLDMKIAHNLKSTSHISLQFDMKCMLLVYVE